MAVPKKDSELVPWSTNCNTRITAVDSPYMIPTATVTTYSGAHVDFLAAYQAANNPGDRSKSLITAKEVAKAALLAVAREVYSAVQVNMQISDADKDLLGVKVRSMPSPIPAPTVAPGLDILSVTGHAVSVRLHDATGTGKRTKPAGVKGAAIFSYVGPVAPSDPAAYKWEGNTNRPIVSIVFPDSVAPGSVVWLTATWLNNRNENGPGCTPQSTNIQYGGIGMSQPMKIAA